MINTGEGPPFSTQKGLMYRVTKNDLQSPPMRTSVPYSVQRTKGTGYVDGALDKGCLGWRL